MSDELSKEEILEEVREFITFKNPNNFDEYFSMVLPRTSTINYTYVSRDTLLNQSQNKARRKKVPRKQPNPTRTEFVEDCKTEIAKLDLCYNAKVNSDIKVNTTNEKNVYHNMFKSQPLKKKDKLQQNNQGRNNLGGNILLNRAIRKTCPTNTTKNNSDEMKQNQRDFNINTIPSIQIRNSHYNSNIKVKKTLNQMKDNIWNEESSEKIEKFEKEDYSNNNFGNNNFSKLKNNFSKRGLGDKSLELPQSSKLGNNISKPKFININLIDSNHSSPKLELIDINNRDEEYDCSNRNNNLNFNSNLNESLSSHDCYICGWSYPEGMSVDEKNVHVNFCLEGKGDEHRKTYTSSLEMINSQYSKGKKDNNGNKSNNGNVSSYYNDNCPQCGKIFTVKSQKIKNNHVIDCIREREEFERRNGKKRKCAMKNEFFFN